MQVSVKVNCAMKMLAEALVGGHYKQPKQFRWTQHFPKANRTFSGLFQLPLEKSGQVNISFSAFFEMQILAEQRGAPKRWQHIVFAVILLRLLRSQKSRGTLGR